MNSLQASEHTHHGLNFAESSLLDDSSDNIKARLSMPLIFPKLRYLGLHQRMYLTHQALARQFACPSE